MYEILKARSLELQNPGPDPKTVERARQDAREGRGGTIDEILDDLDGGGSNSIPPG